MLGPQLRTVAKKPFARVLLMPAKLCFAADSLLSEQRRWMKSPEE
jgi:hypothetical protein